MVGHIQHISSPSGFISNDKGDDFFLYKSLECTRVDQGFENSLHTICPGGNAHVLDWSIPVPSFEAAPMYFAISIAVSCIAMHEEKTFTTSDRQRLHSSHQTENYADSRIRKFTQAAWLPNLIYMFVQRCMVFN
jgi:hypothetical protein